MYCPTCKHHLMQGLNAPEGLWHYHCRYCGTQVTEAIEHGDDGWDSTRYVAVPEYYQQLHPSLFPQASTTK